MFTAMMQEALDAMRKTGREPQAQIPSPPVPPADRIILGLDLGEVKDFTALNALQQTKKQDEKGRTRRHYISRLLHRWPLRTGYEQIIEGVRTTAQKLPVPPELVLDATGAGRPVAQMFRRAQLPIKRFIPAIITGGTKLIREPDGYWHVPKRELVSCVLAASQSRRLQIVPTLREAKTLIRELQRFRSKININSGNESFEAWREKDHDDLVLATALALWWGEYGGHRLTADMFHV